MDLSFPRPTPDGDAPHAAGLVSSAELAAIAAALGAAPAPAVGTAAATAPLVAGAFNPAMADRLHRWRLDGGGP